MAENYLEKALRAGLAAVVESAAICTQVRSELVKSDQVAKGDKSPVTVADLGVQALVINRLFSQFPEIPFVGEEDAEFLRSNAELRLRVVSAVQRVDSTLEQSDILDAIDRGCHEGGRGERFWTLDPIDGTKGFLRNDQYAIALALVEDGEVVLGILGCPALPEKSGDQLSPVGCFLTAIKGQGSALYNSTGNPVSRICVSPESNPASSRFCESVESGHSKHDWAAQVAERLGIGAPSVRMDSQCKYAAIARGDAEIYLRLPTRPGYQERIWDHAAGLLCVTEAGGMVSDIHGRPLDFACGRALSKNEGVIATNGKFHDAVVQAIRNTKEG